MTPAIIPSLEYRLGLTSGLCPHCGQPLPETDVVEVTPETVVDHYETWLADKHWHRKTAPILVVCVEQGEVAK